MKGVLNTAVGYCGGTFDNPNYQIVCSGISGHAETVEVTFDPAVISYDELLKIFWSMHNPTQGGRIFNLGSQYRAAIFCSNEEQFAIAKQSALAMEKVLGKKVTTEISSLETFWKAEEYHQQYYAKKGYSSCRI